LVGVRWIAAGESYENYESRSSAEDEKEEKETLDAVGVMLDLGVDVNEADQSGNTALFGAAAKGFDSVVQLLVDKGANVNAANKLGQTPLSVTRGGRNAGGFKRTADLLRKLGAIERSPATPIARIRSEADYSMAMKEVAMQAAALRKALTSASEDDTANAAARLEAVFKEVQAFWAAKKLEYATTEASNAVAAAQAVSKAVAAHDMDTAGLAAQKVNGSCTACHAAHRERLPDGTFKIK
jgi:Ankyrin repeat